MTDIVTQMLSSYKANTVDEKRMALKEVIQNTILCALATDGFFSHAAFYGGTALRIFHNLNRFSEDLDFTLISKSKDFKLLTYFDDIKNTFKEYGIDISIIYKEKRMETTIQSAFLKSNSKN